MPLILAIEPDRRQAAHLTQIVRQRVGAELILAETTELALAQIGNRVPDLILVPALMSPTDDAALAAALRVIATAAHVQMLTTPLFASAAPEPKARGVLAAFRRAKPTKPSTDGCDPAEFAQQISSYLESAAEERATAQHIEAPLPVSAPAPRPPAEAPQRYVPLEPGRLYRDEATTSPDLETPPFVNTAQDAAGVSFEPEPLAEITEPLFESVEPGELASEQPPVYEIYAETVSEADATLAESLLEIPEPVLETAEPVLETSEPMFAAPEPMLAAEEATFEAPEPMFAAPETTFETPEPAFELPEPAFAVSETTLEAPEPVFEAPVQAFEVQEPTLAASEITLETPEPMFAVPEPVFEAPTGVDEAPAPAYEAEDAVVETTDPILETPQPLSARGPAYPRRIGFVVHETGAETTPLAAQPFDIETEPLEIAASIDTDFVVEAVSEAGLELETAAPYSASLDDEAIELGTVDLSSALSEFDDLLVVDAQSNVSIEEPGVEEVTVEAASFSDDNFNDAGVSEIDANDVEVAQRMQTPEIVETAATAAPQARVFEFDALKEFAASLEAVSTPPVQAALTTDQTHQAGAPDPFEFDDLFPRREPVEPSPLGAWRSWMPLEGIVAEAWDTHAPAHVVERAVERPAEKRAPERPDWVQLVESLRIDVERRRSEKPAAAAPKPPRNAPTRPIQDEWGLFDPAQCGFAALLDKLEEITEANATRPRRSA
jgi:hypothetical protein